MDNRIRNGAIAGVLVVAVVVLVLLFVVPRTGHVCKLSSEPPKGADVTNFKTSDFKAMANMAGYLIYTKQQDQKEVQSYLGLDLNSIEQTGSLKEPKEPAKLKLATFCADLTVVLPTDKNSSFPFYFQLDNISSDGDKTTCTTSSRLALRADQYYSCQKTQIYECMNDKKLVAHLQLDVLEFELDGDPNLIKQDKFSKSKQSCV